MGIPEGVRLDEAEKGRRIQHKKRRELYEVPKDSVNRCIGEEEGKARTEHMVKMRNTTPLSLATGKSETTNIGCLALSMVRDDKGTKWKT